MKYKENIEMEANRKKIHEMIDSITKPGVLSYFETFIRRWIEIWG